MYGTHWTPLTRPVPVGGGGGGGGGGAEFAAWTNLRTLKVAGNHLNGHLPPQWGRNNTSETTSRLYSSLTTLDLTGNSLSGAIPWSWSSLTSLSCVSMAGNGEMCGSVPLGLPCFEANRTNIGAHTTR